MRHALRLRAMLRKTTGICVCPRREYRGSTMVNTGVTPENKDSSQRTRSRKDTRRYGYSNFDYSLPWHGTADAI
jgi:hypothetical protein